VIRRLLLTAVLLNIFNLSVFATTLKELHHPLLSSGQFKLSPFFKIYNIKHYYAIVYQGSGSYIYTNFNWFPQIAYGFKNNLQFSIKGTYHLPKEFSSPLPAAEWWYSKEKTRLYSLLSELVYRPSEQFELSISALWGKSKINTSYSATASINAKEVEDYRTNILTFRGTWLSNPTHSHKTIKPDLEGLHHPLLDKGQLKLQPEIQVSWHDYSYNSSDDSTSDYSRQDTEINRIYFMPSLKYGVTEKLQIEGNVFYCLPYYVNSYSEGKFTWFDYSRMRTENKKRKFTDNTGVKLSLINRFSSQFELFLNTSYYRYETNYSVEIIKEYINGILQPEYSYGSGTEFRMKSIKLGGSWVSKTKKPGAPLTTDLDGLEHPLLEKNQVKIDSYIYYEYYKEYEDDFIFSFINAQITYGVLGSLQFSGSIGCSFHKNLYTRYKYERQFCGNLTMKLRHKENIEVYLAANFSPVRADKFPPYIDPYHRWDFEYIDFQNNYYSENFNLNLGIVLLF
jgi:hypothetical protein